MGIFSPAQLQAADDVINAIVTNQAGTINVLSNDSFNGNPVTLSDVTVTPAQGNFLTLGSDGILTYYAVLPGTYVLTYQICVQGSPNDCSAGVVVLNVQCPNLPSPNISSVVQATCQNPITSITIDNVPQDGFLIYSVNGGAMQTVQGTTNMITVSIPTSIGLSSYTFQFGYGECSSPTTQISISGIGALELSMTGTYNDFNNNGVTDVGDVINYQYILQNDSCADATNLQVFAGQTPVNGGPLATLPIGATDNTTFSSVHILSQSDISNGSVSQSSYVTMQNEVAYQAFVAVSLNISDGFKMVAFVDANSNGIKDLGETDFEYGQYNYIRNNDGTTHHITSSQWHIIYETNPANTYDLSCSVDAGYAAYYSVSATYTDISVAAGSGITTYYFPVTALPYTDLAVQLFANQSPRPGFIYTNQLAYSNYGNQTIASGTIAFTKDGALTIVSVTPSGSVTTPTGFTFNFTNLLPNETRYLTITLQVPTIPMVALGNVLNNSASVTIPPGDVDVNNNSSLLARTIVGSYDPNEKSESHGAKILHSSFGANDYLTYTVVFENTGTANAINVKVEDLLDSHLDENSVRMVRASHPYTLERINNSLTWTFAGINLPPSVADTDIGHGYVIFQAKPKPGYAVGDIIPNTANIYFDFNPAIVTNTCTTEFVSILSTNDFAFDNFKYYPNPVKNMLIISNEISIEKITIISALGQEVISKNVNDLSANIDVSTLSTGVYLVRAISNDATKTFKIIKE